MEPTIDYTDLFLDYNLWGNESFLFNMSAGNSTFVPVMPPAINKAINLLLVVVLTITMVSMGCTMEVAKIKDHILNPKGVLIAATAQYGIMPLTAFSLAKAFQLSDIPAVVVLICGCCPGGTMSNILALALHGDMNLSIVMTSCSTMLALGMMPLLLYLYCQGFANIQDFVPYGDIMKSLVMILVPCGIGILLNYYRPQYSKTITRTGISILLLAVVVVCTLVTIGVGGSILNVLAPRLMAVGSLMPLIGYSFGYIISSLFKLKHKERRTVAMETGCQNIQLCTTILKLAFPQELIGTLFLFPFVYGVLQLIEAVVLIVVFRTHQYFTREKKEKYQSTPMEEKPTLMEEKPEKSPEGTV
ncbi:sodium/bile acid cotransporter [Cheilinus undulatus]|uniref:sodium/bile acid cotransporter n=1 Tax=Cheilinus undulatus TaxID=241271 RepID=UPI001BD38101|nr:sodium/bile acid cotransporter [Cheilinus undulatus]XP_041661137.1 sodium/bile acid cotransporter [Cheilinus undulatus]